MVEQRIAIDLAMGRGQRVFQIVLGHPGVEHERSDMLADLESMPISVSARANM